jgi:hypothetical protein
MNKEKTQKVKEAYLYLDSFIECETSNRINCIDCGTEILATSVVPFNEALKALGLLKIVLDI